MEFKMQLTKQPLMCRIFGHKRYYEAQGFAVNPYKKLLWICERPHCFVNCGARI